MEVIDAAGVNVSIGIDDIVDPWFPMGKGVYMEELVEAIKARGLEVPPFYGLALDDESVDMDKIIADFRAFIEGVCE